MSPELRQEPCARPAETGTAETVLDATGDGRHTGKPSAPPLDAESPPAAHPDRPDAALPSRRLRLRRKVRRVADGRVQGRAPRAPCQQAGRRSLAALRRDCALALDGEVCIFDQGVLRAARTNPVAYLIRLSPRLPSNQR